MIIALAAVLFLSSQIRSQGLLQQTCQRATFPIILGGSNGHTYLYQINYNAASDAIAAVGSVGDYKLRGDATSGGPVRGYIALYKGIQKQYTWGKFINRASTITIVAFNKPGSKMVCLTQLAEMFYFASATGELLAAKKFGTNILDHFTRSILLSSDSNPKTYIQTNKLDVNLNHAGYRLFKVSMTPFLSNPEWQISSVGTAQYDSALGLDFTEIESRIYMLGIQSSKLLFNRIQDNGLIQWIRSYTTNSNYYNSAAMVHRVINSSLSYMFYAVGFTSQRVYGHFIITSGMLTGQHIYLDQSKLSYQIKAVQIVDQETMMAVLVENASPSYDTVLATLTLTRSTNKIEFKKTFGKQMYFSSLCNFVSTSKFFCGFQQIQDFETLGEPPFEFFTETQYRQQVILSSDESESCYQLNSETPETASLQYLENEMTSTQLGIIYVESTSDAVTLTEDITSADFKILVTSEFTNIDSWCTGPPWFSTLPPPFQPTHILAFIVGQASTFTINQFTAQPTCGTPKPSFKYSIIPRDGAEIPFWLTINEVTAQISVSTDGDNSLVPIRIVGTLSTGQIVQDDFTVFGTTAFPFFYPHLEDQFVQLSKTRTYTLPSTMDQDGIPASIISVKYITQIGQLTNILPSFIKYNSQTKQFDIQPTSLLEVRTHQIQFLLQNALESISLFVWNIRIINNPPHFLSDLKNQTVYLGSTVLYTFPKAIDDEGNTIFYRFSGGIPDFVVCANDQLIISPNRPEDLGLHVFYVKLTDTLATQNYPFQITVLKDELPDSLTNLVNSLTNSGSPVFANQIEPLHLSSGTIFTLHLPIASDLDNDNIIVKVSLGEALTFTVFDKGIFTFKPLRSDSQIGPYIVKIKLTDDNAYPKSNTYNLLVYVNNQTTMDSSNLTSKNDSLKISTNPLTAGIYNILTYRSVSDIEPNVTKSIASLKILRISQNGKLTLRILSDYLQDVMVSMIQDDDLSIYLESEKDQTTNYVNFTIVKKDTQTGILTIQLNFNYPETISTASELDKIFIMLQRDIIVALNPVNDSQKRVLSKSFIKRVVILLRGKSYMKEVPPQLLESQLQLAQDIQAASSYASLVLLPSTLLVNIFLSIFSNFIWSFLNDLSYIMALSYISISVPGVVSIIQQGFLGFIYMDLLQTDQWFPSMFFPDNTEDEDESLNPYFEINGLPSTNLILNLQSSFAFLIIFLSLHVLLAMLNMITKFITRDVLNRMQSKLQELLIWNGSIRFLLQQFTPLYLAGLINMYDVSIGQVTTIVLQLSFASPGKQIGSLLSILIILFTPIVLFTLAYKIRKQLKSQSLDKQYQALFEGLQIKQKGTLGAYWNIIILGRWMITILILVVLRNYNAIQIMLLLLLSFFSMMLLIVAKPMASMIENKALIFNEAMVSLYLYLLMTLTDFNGLNPAKYEFGITLLCTIFVTVLVNLAKTVFQMVLTCRMRRRYIKRTKIYNEQSSQEYSVVNRNASLQAFPFLNKTGNTTSTSFMMSEEGMLNQERISGVQTTIINEQSNFQLSIIQSLPLLRKRHNTNEPNTDHLNENPDGKDLASKVNVNQQQENKNISVAKKLLIIEPESEPPLIDEESNYPYQTLPKEQEGNHEPSLKTAIGSDDYLEEQIRRIANARPQVLHQFIPFSENIDEEQKISEDQKRSTAQEKFEINEQMADITKMAQQNLDLLLQTLKMISQDQEINDHEHLSKQNIE